MAALKREYIRHGWFLADVVLWLVWSKNILFPEKVQKNSKKIQKIKFFSKSVSKRAEGPVTSLKGIVKIMLENRLKIVKLCSAPSRPYGKQDATAMVISTPPIDALERWISEQTRISLLTWYLNLRGTLVTEFDWNFPKKLYFFSKSRCSQWFHSSVRSCQSIIIFKHISLFQEINYICIQKPTPWLRQSEFRSEAPPIFSDFIDKKSE